MYSTPTTPARYSLTAIVLHWLLALAIILAFCVGPVHDEPAFLDGRESSSTTSTNGPASPSCCCPPVRLLWRLFNKPPADLPMPAWQAHGRPR